MTTVYTYQRHLLHMDRAVYAVASAMIGLAWLVPRVVYETNFLLVRSPSRLSLYLTATIVSAGLLLLTVARDLRRTAFLVTRERIAVKAPGRARAISFSAVKEVRFGRILWFVAYAVVRSDTATIVLPLVIRDFAGLLETIRSRLEDAGNAGVVSGELYDRMVARARINDLSEERTFRALPVLTRLTFWAGLTGFVVAYRVWCLPGLVAAAWSLLSMVVPLTAYLSANSLISLAIRGQASSRWEETPHVDTQRVYGVVGGIALAAYLVAGILFRNFCWHLGL